VNAAVKESRIALKADIDSASQVMNASIAREGAALSGNVLSAKDNILIEVRATKKIAVISVIVAYIMVAITIPLVMWLLGR
jgi:hypothetical protein